MTTIALGRTVCAICQSEVKLDDGADWTDKRIRTRDDSIAPPYYGGMVQIADATCSRCGARYSAWRGTLYGDIPIGRDFMDLSFRSTFSAWPGPSDLPSQSMLQQIHEEIWFERSRALRAQAADLVQLAIEAEDAAATGTSPWEMCRAGVAIGRGGTGGIGGVDSATGTAGAGAAGSDGCVVISWQEKLP